MEETVRDLLTAQDADGAFSTYAPQAQFTKWDVWGRKYILLGLLFFFHICRDEDLGREILAAAMRHADAVLARIERILRRKCRSSRPAWWKADIRSMGR